MTGHGRGRDGVRQVAVLSTAIAQVALPALLLPRVPRDVEPPDVLQPAPWTFAVWLPIYATSVIHAVGQVRPSRAADPVQRSVGWPLVAAYTPLAAWAPLLLRRRWWAAQGALFVAAGGAEWARRRVDATTTQDTGHGDAVLPAGTGMLAAWTAAASLVNLGSMLAVRWPVPGGRRARATGVLLTAAVGALTTTVVGTSRPGSSTAGPYAATVVWALAGIAAGHRRTAPELTVTALAAMVPVASRALRRPTPR